jgi:hypothetical protein
MMRLNSAQINAHDGPFFQHWRRQMAASVGGLLVDDLMRAQDG